MQILLQNLFIEFETKEEIKREHFQSNDLKFLRIRVDFGGIPNIMDLVDAFKTVVANSFGEMHRYEKKLLSSIDNTPELANLLDIDDAILRNTFFIHLLLVEMMRMYHCQLL